MMDKILENKKILILAVILLVIIVVGIVITATKGLNYGLIYSKNARLSMYIDANFTDKELKGIAKEVLGKGQIYIQRSSSRENAVAITAKQISEEQVDSIIQKVNEKYGITINKAEHTYVTENGNVRGRHIIYPYVIQLGIGTVVVIAYLSIRYKKVGIPKVIIMSLSFLIITQLLYLSVLAITRLPVNLFTMPVVLLIYLLTILGVTIKLEQIKKEPKKAK